MMSSGLDESGEEVLVRPPAHPVPSLQGPFEESMVESVNEAAENDIPIDAVMRRTLLLDSAYYQRVVAGRWKQKPGERYHPLWKLVAQMSFGLHLLARNLAKSEDEVMKILQAHVDDIDGFLERTAEDFDLAQEDMQERLRCLRLPLQHGEVFDRMLEEKAFRTSILEGNEKIEHIVRRTKRALKDALKDVQKGFDATNVLDKYLSGLTSAWQRESSEHEAVLVAMLGNVEGWRRAFMELHLQGNKLAGTLKKLTEIVGEMERRAAAASRNVVVRTSTSASVSSLQEQEKTRVASPSNNHPNSARASVQKPLPGPPGKRSSTRASSRSTHLADYSSQRNSAEFSSGSRPQSNNSQTNSGRGTPSTSLSIALLGSDIASRDGTPRKAAIASKTSPIQEDWQNETPIELPADVPEEVMRNAPVSIKNRLSMTLGLKPKDNADHRISSIYYPRALGDLLKIPQSPQFKASPQLVAARGTAVRSNSPMTDSDADYFSAHERSPSIGHITPGTKKFLDSPASTPDNTVPRISVRSPTAEQEDSQRRSSVPNPGLTSHPSVMQMASPPAELSAVFENQETAHTSAPRPRQESQSSLGEPGPEIAEAGSAGAHYHQADVEIAIIPPEGLVLGQTAIHELDDDRVVTVKAPADPKAATGEADPQSVDEASSSSDGKTAADKVSALKTQEADEKAGDAGEASLKKDPVAEPDLVGQMQSEEQVPKDSLQAPSSEETSQGQKLPTPSGEVPETPANEDTITTFIAELEALPTGKPTRPVTTQPTSPIELEAPVQTFVLPPRSKAKMSQGKDWPSATIKDRADFFKLPNEQAVKPGMKPRDFKGMGTQEPGPVRPLRLKMAKFDGKLVPVQVHTPPKDKPGVPVRTSRLSQDIIANLIEQISKTPTDTPAHSRSGSAASSNSAKVPPERSSHALGPHASAPTPPAPGGRVMVNPDYSSIGQFDRERKHSKENSRGSKAGSMGGLKDILSGSRKTSSDSSARSHGLTGSSRVQSMSARGSGSDMLTSAGKDVLWFKDETNRDSAASGVKGAEGLAAATS